MTLWTRELLTVTADLRCGFPYVKMLKLINFLIFSSEVGVPLAEFSLFKLRFDFASDFDLL